MERIDITEWQRMDFVKFYSGQWQLPVLPIRADKRPDVREWNQYKVRLPTLEELETCKKAWGITLILQNKLFCVDFDTRHGYELLKDKIPAGACIAKTPHGYHVLMRSSTIVPETIRGNNPQWLSCLERLDPKLVEMRKDGSKQAKVDLLGNNSLLHSPDSPGYTSLGLYREPVSVPFEEWMKDVFGYTVPLPRLTDFVKLGATTTPRWVNEYCPWCEADGLTHDSPSCQVDVEGGGFKCHGSCGRTGKLTEFVAKAQEAGMPLKHGAEIMEAYKRFSTLEEKPIQSSLIIPSEKLIFSAAEPVTAEEMADPVVPGIIWRGFIVELYGASGVGKTSYITSGAVDLALPHGRLWGDWALRQPCRQLYLDLENAVGESRQAIQTAASAIGKPEAAKLIDVAELIGKGFDISKPEWRDWLNSAIAQNGYVVVWLDNLGKATGRNTIDDYEMKQVVNLELRPIVRRHNIILFIIHHTGWAKYDSAGRELPAHGKGGSSLFEDVNVCFRLKVVSKFVTRLTVEKARARQSIIRPGDEFLHHYDEKTMRLTPATWRPFASLTSQLVEKLGLDKVAEKLGCNKSTVSRYVHGLRQPDDAVKAKLAELAKAEGISPRLNDVVEGWQ